MAEIDIELLTKAHDRGAFDCGEPRQNEFLKQRARKHAEQKFSQTWVAVRQSEKQILGFVALSMGNVLFENASAEVTKGLPRYPIPVIHVGQLATDYRYQGKGIGALLLAFAMRKAVEISQSIGCYAIELFAQDQSALDYYQRRGFLSLSESSSRLYLPIKSIEYAIGP